jgi:hypothetical protein
MKKKRIYYKITDSNQKISLRINLLFYYGFYRIFIDGFFSEPIKIVISENFGHKVVSFEASCNCLENFVSIPRDLCNFEVVGVSLTSGASFSISSVKFTLLG